jgi:hypothetical protein
VSWPNALAAPPGTPEDAAAHRIPGLADDAVEKVDEPLNEVEHH